MKVNFGAEEIFTPITVKEARSKEIHNVLYKGKKVTRILQIQTEEPKYVLILEEKQSDGRNLPMFINSTELVEPMEEHGINVVEYARLRDWFEV